MLSSLSRIVAVSKGCPQGGVLSPLLWCLVVEDPLARLSGVVYAQGYADDISLLAVGKFPNTVSGLIQMALGTVLPPREMAAGLGGECQSLEVPGEAPLTGNCGLLVR
jgi:hypothetical protein